jgi:hypothetical protein
VFEYDAELLKQAQLNCLLRVKRAEADFTYFEIAYAAPSLPTHPNGVLRPTIDTFSLLLDVAEGCCLTRRYRMYPRSRPPPSLSVSLLSGTCQRATRPPHYAYAASRAFHAYVSNTTTKRDRLLRRVTLLQHLRRDYKSYCHRPVSGIASELVPCSARCALSARQI